MFGTQKLTELQLRKQALLLESDLNRLALYVECERLSKVGSWAGRIADVRKILGPWALLLAPLAGVALALGLRRRSGWLGSLTKAVALIGPLIQLWRARAAPSNEPQR
jgi:hypothetical protein